MSYATAQDMIDRFGEAELTQLTDRTGAGVIDAAVLGRALDDADSEIDGYLTARYALPLATVPPLLTRVAVDLARFQLFGDRITESVKTRRDNAVALLQSIAKGIVSLGLDPAFQPVQDAGGVAFNSGVRVFDADGLVDY